MTRLRPIPGSAIEEACLWSIVQGYCVWVFRYRHRQHLRWLSMVAYARALGIEPTWPPLTAPLPPDAEETP